MNDRLILYVFVGVVIILEIVSRNRRYRSDDDNLTKYRRTKHNAKYFSRKNLLSKSEYYFWRRLKTKCDEKNIIVCPKVRMEDFVTIKAKENWVRQKYRGYVKSRHIDFVLCDKDLNMIGAVELDDGSHRGANAKKVDALKDDVFSAIGLPLFRIPATRKYDEHIDNMLRQLIGKGDNV